MKKIIAMFLLLTIFLLVSCNNESRDYVNFYVWGDSIEISRYEKIAKDFKEEHNITVKIIPSTGDYYDNLNIYLGSRKNAPDIFFTEQGEILSQIVNDRLLNLNPFITNKDLDIINSNNVDGKIKLWDINNFYRYDGIKFGEGNLYALIKDWSPDFIMWYNKDHIDEYNLNHNLLETDEGYLSYPSETVPLSWDEFLVLSNKLTKIQNGNVIRYGTMLDRVPWKHLFQMIQQTGSKPFINDKYFNYEDQGVIDAFTYFSKLQASNLASSPTIGPSGITSGEAFANGNLSFAWFGSWAYSSYNFDNSSFNLGIAPPPVPYKENLTEEDNYGVSAGMIALAVNNQSPVIDETIKFLNYYMTKGQEYMAKFGFNIPGNQITAESDLFLRPESRELQHINEYFLNFALNYTHPIYYNNYISQINVENQISKNFSTWITNYNLNTLPTMLHSIANDIKNEID